MKSYGEEAGGEIVVLIVLRSLLRSLIMWLAAIEESKDLSVFSLIN